jgi:hypothetical protein
MHPGRQWLVGFVGVALVVHREQAFLDQVLDFVGPAEQPPRQEGAQVRAQAPQEGVVRRRVAGLSADEQRVQFGLDIGRGHRSLRRFGPGRLPVTARAKKIFRPILARRCNPRQRRRE